MNIVARVAHPQPVALASLHVKGRLHLRSVGKALVADLVPQSFRASGLGWYTATIGLLGLIAGIVAGQLWDRVGHPAVFFYGTVFAAVGVIALLGFVPAETRQRNT